MRTRHLLILTWTSQNQVDAKGSWSPGFKESRVFSYTDCACEQSCAPRINSLSFLSISLESLDPLTPWILMILRILLEMIERRKRSRRHENTKTRIVSMTPLGRHGDLLTISATAFAMPAPSRPYFARKIFCEPCSTKVSPIPSRSIRFPVTPSSDRHSSTALPKPP